MGWPCRSVSQCLQQTWSIIWQEQTQLSRETGDLCIAALPICSPPQMRTTPFMALGWCTGKCKRKAERRVPA